jgi:hypothetical protein
MAASATSDAATRLDLSPRRVACVLVCACACLFGQSGATTRSEEPPAASPVLEVLRGSDERSGRCAVRFALPLAAGRWEEPPGSVLIEHGTTLATRVHRRWPDGSVRVALVDAVVDLPGGESGGVDRFGLKLMPRVPPSHGAAFPTSPEPMPSFDLRCVLVDPWGRVLTASVAVSADGRRRRVEWWRLESEDQAAERVRLLAVEVQLTSLERRPGARAVLTVALSNRPTEPIVATETAERNSDPSAESLRLGAVRFDGFAIALPRTLGEVSARDAERLLIPAPRVERDVEVFALLHDRNGPHWLGDLTAKTWRFDLRLPDASDAERSVNVVAARVDLDTWRATGAFGSFGGPAPRPVDAVTARYEAARATAALAAWRAGGTGPFGVFDRRGVDGRNHLTTGSFGPYGSFGDVHDANASGAPRCGSAALDELLTRPSSVWWTIAESMVLQQTLRPSSVFDQAPVLASAEPYRVGLALRSRRAPHGFTRPNYEHVTVDLLADWHLLTGDDLARRELEREALSIPRVLAGVTRRTCRGEGRCLLAGVRVAAALVDSERGDELREFLREHVGRVVLPAIDRVRLESSSRSGVTSGGNEGSVALFAQPPHPAVLRGEVAFDAPWQMASLVMGLTALHRLEGDSEFAEAAVEVAYHMATVGWSEVDRAPKEFVSAGDPGRFECRERSFVDGPRGTDRLWVPALVCARDLARRPARRALFQRRLDALLGSEGIRANPGEARLPLRRRVGVDRWTRLLFDRARAGVSVQGVAENGR